MIAWGKSDDGYCSSKCGRFHISPRWFGRVKPTCYRLLDRARNVKSEASKTQREAKALAATWADLKP